MNEKCNKPAASLIPRWGMYLVCVLPKDHDGQCQPGGECFIHGDYVGRTCQACSDIGTFAAIMAAVS